MVYVALLRGINVGGKNKVDMKKLKAAFEQAGMQNVMTYINSGNVIFRDDSHGPDELIGILEEVILQTFGLNIKVLVRDFANITAVVEALPESWQNDTATKCDVMFLWESADKPEVLDELIIKPDIDDVRYVPGALLWCVAREYVTRSGMMKVAGTPLYRNMTVRNCNTARKLHVLMQQTEAL